MFKVIVDIVGLIHIVFDTVSYLFMFFVPVFVFHYFSVFVLLIDHFI